MKAYNPRLQTTKRSTALPVTTAAPTLPSLNGSRCVSRLNHKLSVCMLGYLRSDPPTGALFSARFRTPTD